MSSRSASASRRTFWASRWSSQKPGSAALASSSERRSSRPARSKTPRGRGDPGGEVADGWLVHLAPCSHLLEQLWTELQDAERRLAAGDDGVHAGAIRIVRTWPAVAIAVEPCGITAGPTIALARDQVGERLVTELRIRRWKRLHGPLSLPLEDTRYRALGPGWPRVHGPRPSARREYTEYDRNATRGASKRPVDSVAGRVGTGAYTWRSHAQHPGPPRGRRQ